MVSTTKSRTFVYFWVFVFLCICTFTAVWGTVWFLAHDTKLLLNTVSFSFVAMAIEVIRKFSDGTTKPCSIEEGYDSGINVYPCLRHLLFLFDFLLARVLLYTRNTFQSHRKEKNPFLSSILHGLVVPSKNFLGASIAMVCGVN